MVMFCNCSRLFHIYTYFLLFYNALIGMGKAMRRIFTSAVISLFFLPRLDRSLLIEGFHKLDKGIIYMWFLLHYSYALCLQCAHPAGYIAYLSAVRLDAAYNNPVMNVFVYLLSQERTSYNTTSIYAQCAYVPIYSPTHTCIHTYTHIYTCTQN